MTARSEGPARGSTFTIELPAAPVPDALVPLPPGPGETGSSSEGRPAALDGVRVLVVDDDDDDSRDLVAAILVEHGATVASASSAREALRLVEDTLPDVLVSDIGMPEVSGYSLIREIRGMSGTRAGSTPAIALTAYGRAADAQRALAVGFQAHVTKPVDPDGLASLVASLAGVVAAR